MKRGPRPRYGEPANRVIHIRLTRRQYRDLTQVARDNQTTLAGLIREAVEEFVADYRENDPVFNP